MARKGSHTDFLTIEEYFTKYNFDGGQRKLPTIAYILLPPIKCVDDIQRAAWYFVLKRRPHRQISEVVDITQSRRTFAQSCVELGIVGSAEGRQVYKSFIDKACKLSSITGIA